MTRRAQRLLVVLSALLLCGTVAVLFAIRADFSHFYAHALGPQHVALPSLTHDFAIPVLGGDAARGRGRALFALVWSAVFLLPLAAMAWSLSSPNRPGSNEQAVALRWLLFSAVYVPLLATFCLAFAYALWLPFAPM